MEEMYRKMDGTLAGNFKEAIGPTTINYVRMESPCNPDDCPTYGGTWEGNHVITMKERYEGRYYPGNLVHEYGHMINNEIFFEWPEKSLGSKAYYDANGEFVMGKRNGAYDRQTGLGYLFPCSLTVSACYSEQHTRYWEPDGNGGDEEFADMFMSLTLNMLDLDTAAGIARYNFVREWLDKIIYSDEDTDAIRRK